VARVVVLLLVLLASTVLTPKKETKGMKMNWVKLHYNLVNLSHYCAFRKGCEKLAGQKVANPFFFFRALCLIRTWQATEPENPQYI